MKTLFPETAASQDALVSSVARAAPRIREMVRARSAMAGRLDAKSNKN